MRQKPEPARFCANEGCDRPVPPGEVLCETCALESILYRRDMRPLFVESSGEKPAGESRETPVR